MDIKRAKKVYEAIKDKLKGDEGKIIAIEPESGDYFVGNDTMQALETARQKHPNKQFYFMRIGARATYFIGAYENKILVRNAICNPANT